jgi:hypothetical protein
MNGYGHKSITYKNQEMLVQLKIDMNCIDIQNMEGCLEQWF